MTNETNHNLATPIALAFLAVALLAYLIPWSTSAVNSLTMGAYDLAEWLSVHPATQPLRLPSLLLRCQLLIITWLFALEYATYRRWLWFAVIAMLAAAQLPPLDFITRLGDTNQQQQFILATLSLLGAGVCIWIAQKPIRLFFLVGFAITGIITTIIGAIQARSLIAQYQSSTLVGIGVPVLVGVYTAWIVWNIFKSKKTNRIAN